MIRSVNFVRHLFWIWFMLHAVTSHAVGAETMQVQLGEHRFNIPKKNIREAVPFWLQFIPGLVPERESLMFTLEAEQVAGRVAGYQVYDGELKADLMGLVEVLDESELQTYLDPNTHIYSDIWYNRGLYEDLITEWREELGFYKAYQEGDDVFWKVLRIPPRSREDMPDNPFDFWVASCVKTTSPLTNTGHITGCRTRVFYDNLYFQFRVYLLNLHLIDEIRAAVLDIFKEWEE